jgi:hypothetical protein
MKDTEAAFLWIIGILRKYDIPFQIGGGFAARLYGATRELADIDIDIPEDRFSEIISDVKDYIKFGPAQYRDDSWDLFLMTLSYGGQDIDIAGAYDCKVFDQSKKEWATVRDDFTTASIKSIYGINVPVMNRDGLIAYKTMLGRDVDKIDIAQLQSARQ